MVQTLRSRYEDSGLSDATASTYDKVKWRVFFINFAKGKTYKKGSRSEIISNSLQEEDYR